MHWDYLEDRLRPLSYPQTDVFILCFAINDRDSFDHARERWHPELIHHCPNTPIILVGTKADLRSSGAIKGQRPWRKEAAPEVSEQEGIDLALVLGCVKYIECSAKTMHNVKAVIEEAMRSVVFAPRGGKKKQGALSHI